MNELLELGAIVRNPAAPEWGRGQIQSIVGGRATVNFEHAGKVVINLDEASLELDTPD
ncbi:MAG: DUF3553 domain-containing protein [Rubrimonas sp.]